MRPKKSLILFYRNNKHIFLFLLIFTFFLVILIRGARLFSISHINLSGTDHINGIDKLYRKIIFFISIPESEKNLYSENPHIQSVKVNKLYPNTLHIIIQKAEPIAQLVVDEGFFVLSDDARIITKARKKDTEIPTISYYQKLHFNEYERGEILAKKDITFSVFFIKSFIRDEILVDSVDIVNLNMILLNSEGKKYIFTADKEKESQLKIFQTIYTRMKVDGIEYRTLDMRFEKPIIKI